MGKIILLLFVIAATFTLTGAEGKKALALREKLAGQLLIDMGMKKQISASFAAVKELQRQTVARMLQNAKESKELTEFKVKISAISTELSWKNVEGVFVAVYAKAYSVDELQKLNAFFSSPAGKAFLAKMPELQGQLVLVIQNQIKNTSFKIRKMAHEFMKGQMLKGQTKMPESLKAKTTSK